ncbi:MAG: Flp family type IVb pilin [Candidatus Riflebacteria bacterium]|nr:Flp family type IVb pilin [Candidatus Riflebacteria bacterium]
MKNFKNRRGQGLVEYALILVLVAVVIVAILTLMGPQIAEIFNSINEKIENSTGETGGTYPATEPVGNSDLPGRGR